MCIGHSTVRVKIYMKDTSIIQHEFKDYVLSAEPNDNGDLIVYRSHLNMISAQPIASYAAGTWKRQELVWDE